MSTPSHRTSVYKNGTYEAYAADTPSNDQRADEPAASAGDLLTRVLGETLARSHEDPAEMLDALKQWRATMKGNSFDQPTCQQLVSQVLDFRLGSSAAELSDQLRQEVGSVLWDNPESRSRIENIWYSIAAS